MAFQLTNLDFTGNQALNMVLHNLAAPPATPKNGQVWFDTVAQRILVRTSGGNIDTTARANHSGTQTAATISDFHARVRENKLSEMAAPDAPLSLANQRLTLLGTPTAPTDAATKAYADSITSSLTTYRLDQFAAPTAALNINNQRVTSLGAPVAATDAVRLQDIQDIQNGIKWKDPVRLATTANVTLSGLQTLDGVAGAENNRVLVKNQTVGSQNGLYNMKSGAWTRTTDGGAGQLVAGIAVMVTEGATQGDAQFRLQTDDPITVGSTALTFSQIGAAVSYTNGWGILLTGNAFSVDKTLLVGKASASIGDGTAVQFSVAHNLGTKDVTVGVYYNATGDEVYCDVTRPDINTVILSFAVAPATGALRAVIHG
jgi:hypothetical protein